MAPATTTTVVAAAMAAPGATGAGAAVKMVEAVGILGARAGTTKAGIGTKVETP
jgi:hypothetical protein